MQVRSDCLAYASGFIAREACVLISGKPEEKLNSLARLGAKPGHLVVSQEAKRLDPGELPDGCGPAGIVKCSRQFLVAIVHKPEDGQISLVIGLALLGADAGNLGEHPLAEAIERHGGKLAKDLPVRFGDMS